MSVDFKSDHFLQSFSPTKKNNVIMCCKVNLLDLGRRQSQKNWRINHDCDFRYLFFITRNTEKESKFPYCITTSCNLKDVFDLGNLKRAKLNEKENTIQFTFARESYFWLEFQYKFDYFCARRIIWMKHRRFNENKFPEIVQGEKSDDLPCVTDFIRNYEDLQLVEEEEKKAEKSYLPTSTQSVQSVGGNSIDQELYTDLVRTKVDDWSGKELFSWFEQIPVNSKTRIISLFTYLKKTSLDMIFNDFFKKFKKPVPILRSHIEGTNEEPLSDESVELQKILDDEIVVDRLQRHFRVLKLIGQYNPGYYITLKKRLDCIDISKENKVRPNTIELYEKNVALRFSSDFSLRSLRLKLGFNFLYSMSIDEYIKHIESKFETIKRVKNHPTLRTYLDKLNHYCEKLGFDVTKISLKLRFHKQLWMIENEIDETLQECVSLQSRLMRDAKIIREEANEKFKDQLDLIKQREEELDPKHKLYGKIKKVVEKKKKSVNNKIDDYVEKEMTRTAEELSEKNGHGKLLEKKKSEFLRRENQALATDKLRWEMKNLQDGVFYECLKERIDTKLDTILNVEKNLISISAKCVLCRYLKKSIKFYEKWAMGLCKGAFSEEQIKMFRMGLTHSGIIICNVAFHLFSGDLIVCEDLKKLTNVMEKYEDICCIDAHTIEVYSSDQFFELVDDIAKFVLDKNLNWSHSNFGIRSMQHKKMNCQEFSQKLLEKLSLPSKFFPETETFIDEMANPNYITIEGEIMGFEDSDDDEDFISMSTQKKVLKKIKGETVRRIHIPETFSSELRKQLRLKEDQKFKYFLTHRDLDIFVSKLKDELDDFELDYPGLNQLLKSFDRAWWVMKTHRWDDKSDRVRRNEPFVDEHGKEKCPFHSLDDEKEKKEEKDDPKLKDSEDEDDDDEEEETEGEV